MAMSSSELTKSDRGTKTNLLDAELEKTADHLQLQMLLIEVASSNDQADFPLISQAYFFANTFHSGQTRKSGKPFLQHCVEVARILAQLRLDATTVAAGLLHDVLEDTPATYTMVAKEFGEKIAALIDGVTKIEQFQFESQEARQAETYRKMLLSVTQDIRVILIKFADRLHNMRTLDHVTPAQQLRIAHETLEVYSPLAHRFGLARIRGELEDLSLKYLDFESYQSIRENVAMKRAEREAYLEEFKNPIEEELRHNGIEAEITARAKRFYSIYTKMSSREKSFEEIYDLMAVRILVGTVRECYHTLGLVHTLYRPIPDRFKDYIATPKSNMYQSLHTSVIGPRGLPVEIQMRTQEMHHTAEIGIAAHWRYKTGEEGQSELDQHLHWLRQVLDWQQDATDPAEFMESLKIDLFQDEIFVFTPQGDLHQLPKSATPIDFAFAVHTDIGFQCLTAKINGQVSPLGTELNSGDYVEITTSRNQKPKQAWLELVKTSKARHCIRKFLKEERFNHSTRLGREMLERELRRYRSKIGNQDLLIACGDLGYDDEEHLYAALGTGDLSLPRLVNRLMPNQTSPKRRPAAKDSRGIRIQGMDDTMISFASCCTPIPGDQIIGLVTRGRGVTVHRLGCANIVDLSGQPERLVHVEWDLESECAFTVKLRIRSNDRKYLLSEIAKSISDTGANIKSSSTRTEGNVAVEEFWLDVSDTKQLKLAIDRVMEVDGVLDVRRVDQAESVVPLS